MEMGAVGKAYSRYGQVCTPEGKFFPSSAEQTRQEHASRHSRCTQKTAAQRQYRRREELHDISDLCVGRRPGGGRAAAEGIPGTVQENIFSTGRGMFSLRFFPVRRNDSATFPCVTVCAPELVFAAPFYRK